MSRFVILLSITTCLFVTGCGGDMPSKQVGKHTFLVPDRYLVRGTILWLPASQSDNLMFTLNPDVPLEQQIVVLVQPAGRICPPTTEPSTNALERVCNVQPNAIDSENGNLEKVFWNGDTTQWDYKDDRGNVVASCFSKTDDEEKGLCSSLGRYEDLVFSFGVQESAVGRLPILRGEVVDLLTAWEAG